MWNPTGRNRQVSPEEQLTRENAVNRVLCNLNLTSASP